MSFKLSNKEPVAKAPMDREASRSRLFLLTVAGLSAALFLPLMGRGFIHDDFVHLHSVAYHSLWHGLTHANGGPFYTPITWLTFKLDWVLWGKNPFLMAAGNLSLHIANITLLYAFALKLWRSRTAARWAALGFALLFPANTWAVMWISARAHLIVTFFYLAALLATLRLSRAESHRKSAVLAVVLFATLSAFSKESGVTAPVAIAITLIYVRLSHGRNILPPATVVGLFGSLIAAFAAYALVRGRSEAIPITFSANDWYSYAPSLKVLLENLLRYGWRTYGLVGIMACSITLSLIIRGRRPRLDSFTMNDALLSASLFATTIAPFILLRGRSGIYTYLPGTAAALLLGAAARAFYDAPLCAEGEVMKHGASKQLAPHAYAAKLFRLCKWLAFPRRRAAPEFSRGFQPTGRSENIPASRERRLNPPRHLAPERDSIVADATQEKIHAHRGLKPTAKFRRRSAAKRRLRRSKLLPQGLNPMATAPILLMVALYSLLTVVHSLKWMRMAEINNFVLNRVAGRVIKPQPNTSFILTYSEADNVNGFPDSLAHGFSCALRMLYADPTLNGSIGRQGESRPVSLQSSVIRLAYINGGAPRLVISSDESCIY